MSPARNIALTALALTAGPLASLASASTSANLSITNPPVTTERTVGSTITYAMQVSNAGPDAVDATVTDQLGAAEELVSASAGKGSCTQTPPATCSLGTLAPGAPAVDVTITVKLVRTGDNAHSDAVSGPADNADPDPNDNVGGAGFQVDEPAAPVTQTPKVVTGSWSRTQSTLAVDASLSPYGSGTYHFEYGRTKAYGEKTAGKNVSGDSDITGKATLTGLDMDTEYHYRAVLVVAGKTYRGRDHSATTMGKLLYGPLTLKAARRTPTATTYTGLLGGGLADAPGACSGKLTIQVYTLQGADLLQTRTHVRPDCTYRATVPFGARQRARYGKKGSVLIQAEFQGNRAVARVGSESDRP
jgi:uncharacterized repeat protein (TIGR01451 family)